MPGRRPWLLALLAGFAVSAGLVQAFLRDLPDVAALDSYRPALPTLVVDRRGRMLGEFFAERRRLLALREAPRHLIQAFVAAEDERFFEHRGVDVGSLLRAFWANSRAGGRIRQGGSTITQQLAKGVLLTSERTFSRKLKDMALALQIERRFDKEKILELYLNQIYFGAGAYGVAQASRTYFGKDVSELSVSEAALLAGLPKAPTAYSPFESAGAAEERRRYVLDRMREIGVLDVEAWRIARADAPRFVRDAPLQQVAAYAVEEVRQVLMERLGAERVLRDGLRVETTLDLDLQQAAFASLRRGVEAVDRRRGGWRGPERGATASLEELGAANGLLPSPRAEPAELPSGRTLSGVVTAIDTDRARARVAFAPGLEGELLAADAAWASRDAGASLTKLLKVGDVARFEVAASAQPPAERPQVRLAQEPAVEGALLALDAASGGVLALVGGYDFERSRFDRATQARRQPGSAFKPFVYAAALEAGFTQTTLLYDYQVEFRNVGRPGWWRPRNYDSVLRGPIPLYESLARSLNNATIRLLDDVGVARTVALARRAGIVSPLADDLGLALGSSELTLLELTRGYATFAAQGRRLSPYLVSRVLDRDGSVVLERVPLARDDPGEDPQAISAVDAYLTTHTLRGAVRRGYGTARDARRLGHSLAGKTGTTNANRDAWFVGFSPDVVAGVWIGDDDTQSLGRGETGARAALPVWVQFMATALADFPVRDFPVPPGVIFAWTDPETGEPKRSARPVAWAEAFAEGRAARKSSYVPPLASELEEQPGTVPIAGVTPFPGGAAALGASEARPVPPPVER